MATTHEWSRLGSEIMDSRDLLAVEEEIREALDDLAEGDESTLEALGSSRGSPDEDETAAREILAAIEAISDAGIEDWQYGAAFIREDYFEQYAQELAEDIGAIKADETWPLSYIDWPAAARALLQDYTEVDYLGTTYYVRA